MLYKTNNAEETIELGRKVGSILKGGELILLKGDLGAGKTTFVQGVAQGLGLSTSIISPTFIIMRKYEVPSNPRIKFLYHLDLYRLAYPAEDELSNIGFNEFNGRPENVLIVEWSEKLSKPIDNAIEIILSSEDDHHLVDIKNLTL